VVPLAVRVSGVVFESAFIVFDRPRPSTGPTAPLLILLPHEGFVWPMARFMVEIFAVGSLPPWELLTILNRCTTSGFVYPSRPIQS